MKASPKAIEIHTEVLTLNLVPLVILLTPDSNKLPAWSLWDRWLLEDYCNHNYQMNHIQFRKLLTLVYTYFKQTTKYYSNWIRESLLSFTRELVEPGAMVVM